LDLLGKIFIDPGDHVVLEDPSYLGAIQAFDAYQARYLTAQTDEEGLIPESLEHVLAHAEPLPKFVYLVPNFQNPTGRTLAASRREPIVRICEHFGVPIVEDDPYGELRFSGHHVRSLAAIPTTGTIIYSGTGSKIMAPGMRIAWLVTRDHDVHDKLVLAKQGADLQSGTLSQYVFAAYVSKRAAFERHLSTIVQVYGERRDVMYAALREFMPGNVTFNRPEGGMFMWARARGVDTTQLLEVSTAQKVAFVPGVSFYPQHNVTDGMRLNFSHSSPEKIRIGIERLARAVRSIS
ncbi:MAG TPA: PLP-dependent aminotransferase family protein, partial [Candidatus Baltobacteraceae bacterium]|nr:PLP-dependent aminotransferase family protein [Candidatus Baltobacteraceae bacterium]